MSMRKIRVVPYDPQWPQKFVAEAAVLRRILGDEIVAMHHVGSTAVPGLKAKPIIDILVEVRDITRIEAYNEAMRAHGYEPMGDYGLPGRRYFPKDVDGERVVHAHVWQVGNSEIERHLVFRDYLRTHPEEAAAYAAVKEELAQRFPDNSTAYVAGKDSFVKAMQQRALAWSKRP